MLGPDDYLEHIRRIKEATALPVIASLNGSTPGGWLDYARLMEQAGADAIELNVYSVATNPDEDGQDHRGPHRRDGEGRQGCGEDPPRGEALAVLHLPRQLRAGDSTTRVPTAS